MEIQVNKPEAGQRLDIFLFNKGASGQASRSMIQSLIRSGHVLVGGRRCKAGYRVQENDTVYITVPEIQPSELIPEQIPFQVLYEDSDIIVISKPPGVVVHPAAGHQEGTLVHGLLFHCHDLSGISGEIRPGIVHRLDKDTSGAMVAAKSDHIHHALIDQFKQREVKKKYRAILSGVPSVLEGRIDKPIGRHPVSRKKMSVRPEHGREAVTHWKVLEEFSGLYSYVELMIETGRTHQIRVHMADLGYPILGDSVYGGKQKEIKSAIRVNRQCLHSYLLSFLHPGTGERMNCKAPLWPDIAEILEFLRNQ